MKRLELDAAAERSVGQLRLFGAMLIVAMSAVLVAQGVGPVGWVLIVSAWLIAAAWVMAFLRSRRRLREADAHYLELGSDALRMVRGSARIEVSWADVVEVEVDEERLVVWVCLRSGPPVKVEPVWRGVGLHELAALLQDAALGGAH